MNHMMEELEQEPFDVSEFIERLTWRASNEIGQDKFDPDVLHETFTQTIKDLKMLQERQQRKCDRLENILKDEQLIYTKNLSELEERHHSSVDKFRQLDEKINNVAGKIIHLGEQLQNVNVPRSRTVEAQRILNYMSEFMCSGPILNDVFMDKSRLHEAADVIQKLYTISQDLPADKFAEAKRKIETKYDDIERQLIEEFTVAQRQENIEKMKIIAQILSQFKGYSQCIDAYIEQSQMISSYTSIGGGNKEKDIFNGIIPMCRHHNSIIKKVFGSPDQVMAKFILNIYQLKLNQFTQTKLDDRQDENRYLKNLYDLYSRTRKLNTDLYEFTVNFTDDSLLVKLTANIFAKYLQNYPDIEMKNLDKQCANELRKYYESKNHQKKQAERFQDLRRDVQALIGTRTNINIGQIEDFAGETFLSEELAINLLQVSKEAFKRCRLLSSNTELTNNVIGLADILLKYLMMEHVDYALNLGLQAIPIVESKTVPNIYFFEIVQQTNTIVHLLEKLYNDSILPCVQLSTRYGECLQKKRTTLEQLETKLDVGLDRAINAVIGWIKVYLQNEQKKTDFKPDTDVDTVSSNCCLYVVQHLIPVLIQIKKCIDGENLECIMSDIGVRLHRVIYEHFQKFEYNTAGAICAICDVNEYRKCIQIMDSQLVNELFDVLHALCNVLLVRHENLLSFCNNRTLNCLDKAVVLNFIQLRSDYKTIKVTLKDISEQKF